MSRGRGGYIGFNRVPAAAGLNSAASGVWTLREAESLKRAGTWPIAFPRGIAGLQLWLDAADAATLFDATTGGSLVAADGGVARWEDKSGNARHATQGTAGRLPARKVAVLGGLDAIRFDGTSGPNGDLFAITSGGGMFRNVSGATVLAVITRQSDGVILRADAGLSNARVFLDFTGNANVRFGGRRLDGDTFQDVQVAFSGTGIVGGILDYENAQAYVVKNTETTQRIGGFQTAGTSSDTDSANVLVGATLADGTNAFGGDIGEIVAYNRALTPNEVLSLTSYFVSKWSIT